MRVIARTIGSQTVGAGTDRVLVGMPLPKGGKFISVSGEIHMIGEESQDTSKFMAYGLSGQMVPVLDPQVSITYNALWDNVIVKASDPVAVAGQTNFDWDWDALTTAPEIEPGEMDIDALLGMTEGQKEFLPASLEFVSWAKSRQGGFILGTPDVFLPSDFKTFRSRRTLVAEEPSMLLIGVSSPSLDEVEVIGAQLSPSSVGQWYMLQNMEETLRDMGKAQAGIIEAGAESPYENATTLIRQLIAKDMLDETTTQYNGQSWQAMISCTWLIDLPGDSLPKSLDGR